MMNLTPSNEPCFEPDIFQFDDPVEILSAYIEFKKRKHPNFTISHWSKKLDLPTSGILFNLLKRRRHLSEDLALKIAQSLHFDSEATEYFHTLVAWSRAKHSNSKVEPDLKNRLHSLRLKKQSVQLSSHEFSELWDLKIIAIKELLILRPGIPTSEIQNTLSIKVSNAEIHNALDILTRYKVIRSDNNGGYEVLIENMDSQTDIPSEKIRSYHKDSLEHAKQCLNEVPIESRYFSNYILPIQTHDLPEAKQDIEDFINRFVAKFQNKSADGNSIYQLNLNFIPITQPPKSRTIEQ